MFARLLVPNSSENWIQYLVGIKDVPDFDTVEKRLAIVDGESSVSGFNTSCTEDGGGLFFELHTDNSIQGKYKLNDGAETEDLPWKATHEFKKFYTVRIVQDGAKARAFVDGQELEPPYPCDSIGDWFNMGVGMSSGGEIEAAFDYVRLWRDPVFASDDEPQVPTDFTLYDDFDGPGPIDNKWHMAIVGGCAKEVANGSFDVRCDTVENDARVGISPKFEDLNQASISAVAAEISTMDILPWTSSQFVWALDYVKDGEIVRRYGLQLSFDQVLVLESYPQDPSEPWRSEVLGQMAPLSGSQTHILTIQREAQEVHFFVDDEPVILQQQPNLPAEYGQTAWIMESSLVGYQEPASLETKAYWVAYKQ